MHNTLSRFRLCKKKENVLASGSHDGEPGSICHPSGSIAILTPAPSSTPQGIDPAIFALYKLLLQSAY
jgi:hypothetical protein